MNDIIAYFTTIPSLHRSLILVGGITVFWVLENAFPLFNFTYKKWHHAGINIFMTFSLAQFQPMATQRAQPLCQWLNS